MVFIRQEIIDKIKKLTRNAGQILLKNFNLPKQNHAKFKSKHEILTTADLIAEKIIINKLKKLTPNFRILSEESGDNKKKSDFLWTVDPLDGTTNYYMGNPLFAVQIALVYKNEPILAFIYSPYIKEFYFAQKNKGAFLNGKKIHVSNKKFKTALLTFCHGSTKSDVLRAIKIYEHFKLASFDIRQIGSAALEFAWVAKGRTECYISPGHRLWDIVPGALIVREAGGRIYDFKGNSWNLVKSKAIFASNGIIDNKVLNFLKKL
ncbi:inositol monophosphatase [Candidatus Falkowbacteria bacterium]|nr:inositol monophosphatase [Candidatus Falkowbacteria bacterium]